MSKKLGIIATNQQMREVIENMYPEEVGSGEYLIDILDAERVDNQGKNLVDKGAKVIIGRCGSYDRSVGNVSIPLLRLKISSLDILYALEEGSKLGSKIELVIWNGVNLDKRLLKYISADINIHRFEYGHEISEIYQQIINSNKDSIIVGGGVICDYAKRDHLKYVFINNSLQSISDIVDNAIDIISYLEIADYYNELIGRTIDNVKDAVLVTNKYGEIELLNKYAEKLLQVESNDIIGKNIGEVFHLLRFLLEDMSRQVERKDEILEFEHIKVTYSTSLIATDDEVMGCIFIFQDTTKLQKLEQKVRMDLNKKGLIAKGKFDDIITKDMYMNKLINKAKIIGNTESSVMICGESGTGKEIIAQSMHNISRRCNAPFVAVNCAAIAEPLLESELFGYVEGAFTGAKKGGKLGLFELAHGGTIFLDEINSMPLRIQGKLLRVLEEREVMRLGSDHVIPLNIRVISAANQDLQPLIIEKKFRDDLFYRLNTMELCIPPLRERRDDIIPLFQYFVHNLQGEIDLLINQENTIKLMTYDWPGNVRELRNVAERYILFNEIDLRIDDYVITHEVEDSLIDLKEIHKLVDERIISHLLKIGISKSEIAKKLGVSRATLWNKLNKV